MGNDVHACEPAKRIASACFALALLLFALLPAPALGETSEVGPSAADGLGVGFEEGSYLDLTFEEVCDLAGVDPAAPGNGLFASPSEGGPDVGPSARSIKPSKYQVLMDYALQYKGWKYVWGGKYPSQGGFDCSGLVTWCYDEALGATIDGWYTNAERIYDEYCDDVSPEDAKPGDIVFWRGTYGSDVDYISHVGIYCGGNICYAAGSPIGFYRIDGLRNIHGDRAEHFFGSMREVDDGVLEPEDGVIMHRVYNPYSGEHFYTSNSYERDALVAAGWNYEGAGWVAPVSSRTPVHRLYSGTDHHYTTSLQERDWLVSKGWSYEGVGWYSDDARRMPLYRQFNPGVDPSASRNNSGSHHYTTSAAERDELISVGWQEEGIGWYGIG